MPFYDIADFQGALLHYLSSTGRKGVRNAESRKPQASGLKYLPSKKKSRDDARCRRAKARMKRRREKFSPAGSACAQKKRSQPTACPLEVFHAYFGIGAENCRKGWQIHFSSGCPVCRKRLKTHFARLIPGQQPAQAGAVFSYSTGNPSITNGSLPHWPRRPFYVARKGRSASRASASSSRSTVARVMR